MVLALGVLLSSLVALGLHAPSSPAASSVPLRSAQRAVFPSISAGGGSFSGERSTFMLVVDRDGTVRSWGSNAWGELGNGTYTHSDTPTVVETADGSALTGIISVSAGTRSSYALRHDGTVYSWGNGASGRLGDGTTTTRNYAAPVLASAGTALTDVIGVAMGDSTGAFLKSDGTLWTVGNGVNGGLGNGTTTSSSYPVQVMVDGTTPLTDVIAVSMHRHGLAIREDGSVWSWGYNAEGAVGNGTTTNTVYAAPVVLDGTNAPLTGAVMVAASFTSFALMADGTVRGWGDNGQRMLTDGTTTDRTYPVTIQASAGTPLTDVRKIDAQGNSMIAAMADGSIRTSGYNGFGMVADGSTTTPSYPVESRLDATTRLTGVSEVAAGRYSGMVALGDGTIWTSGWNVDGALGDGTTTNRSYYGRSHFAARHGYASMAAGCRHSLGLRFDGQVWAIGANEAGQLGNGTATDSTFPGRALRAAGTPLTGVVGVAAGCSHSLALDSAGTVWSWGSDADGQLGDGTAGAGNAYARQVTTDGTQPLTGIVAIAAGSGHSLARRVDGSVWAWGDNASGQLGDGTTADRAVAARVRLDAVPTYLGGTLAIAAGGRHSMAVMPDGSSRAWGEGTAGQLADGASADAAYPVTVREPDGTVFLGSTSSAANGNHSLLLRAGTGTVHGAGANASGQLGDGTTTPAPHPTQVTATSGTPLTAVRQVAAGELFGLATLLDGRVMAWGDNAPGSLGDGGTTGRTRGAPVKTSSTSDLGGAVVADAGTGHGLMLRFDGSLWGWGQNDEGQALSCSVGNRLYAGRMLCDPLVPSALVQHASDGVTTIPVGGYTQDGISNSLHLRFDVTSGLASRTITPWIELLPVGSFFSGECGVAGTGMVSGPAVTTGAAGTPIQATVTVSGLAEGGYRWRACAVDSQGTRSDWEMLGSFPDFGIDTTPPAAPAVVADGTGSDIDWQVSTTDLAANWSTATDSGSGVAGYQYCFSSAVGCTGTLLGGGWTYTTSRSASLGSLSLAVGSTWYVSSRAVDRAGNVGSATTSDGVTIDEPPSFTDRHLDQSIDTSDRAASTAMWDENQTAWRDHAIAHVGAAFASGTWVTNSQPASGDYCGGSGTGGGSAVGDLNMDGLGDVVAGCWGDDQGATNSGRIMVSLRSADNSGFAAGVMLENPSPAASDECGRAVAIADFNADGLGDVVASCQMDDGGGTDAGSAVVYLRTTANDGFLAGLELRVTAPVADDQCGSSVTAGDVNGDGMADVVVGCRRRDPGGSTNAGTAAVFLRRADNTGFDAAVELQAPVLENYAYCGRSVAVGDIDGNGLGDVAMGCYYDDAGASNAGNVAVMLRTATNDGFQSGGELLNPAPGIDDYCGQAVAIGDVNADGRGDVLFGCYRDDAGATDSGSAVLYTRNVANDGFDAAVQLLDPTPAADECGFTVAVGDLNGDGRDDLAVPCYDDDTSGLDTGNVLAFTRNSANGAFDPAVVVLNPNPVDYDRCGMGLAVGDVDGDGLSDIAAGCPNHDTGAANTGGVAVHRANAAARFDDGAVTRATRVATRALDSTMQTVSKATVTLRTVDNGRAAPQLELSATGGASWEPASSGTEHLFSQQGSDLRARVTFTAPGGVVQTKAQVVHDVHVRYVSSTSPAAPASLAQLRSDGTTAIATGAWTTDGATTDVTFRLTVSDPDASQVLTPWVEIRPAGTAFSAACGSSVTGVTFNGADITATTAGSSQTAEVRASGLAPGTQYVWRACAVDQAGARSAWTPHGGSPDFGVDTQAPSTPSAVADGTGSDIDTQASLTSLSANWTASSDTHSGIGRYDYCIATGTQCSGTIVQSWTSAGTGTSMTQTGLTLVDGTTYYVAVRAVDGVGNSSAVASSDGVRVGAAMTVSPAGAPQGRRNLGVTVTGTGFQSGATATFGAGITVVSSTFVSETQVDVVITVAAGAAVGTRDVVVTNPDATSSTLPDGFSVLAPTISVSLSTLGHADTARDTTAPYGVSFGTLLPGVSRSIGPGNSGQATSGAAVEATVASDTDYVLQVSSTDWSDGTNTAAASILSWKHHGVSESWTSMSTTATTSDGPAAPTASRVHAHDLQVSVPAAQPAGSYSATASYTAIAAP